MIEWSSSLNLNIPSLLTGISLPLLGTWLTSFLALRKNERIIEIEEITRERAKWRKNMRKLTATIAAQYHENKTKPNPGNVAYLRCLLETSINPKDDQEDQKILEHFDDLFSNQKSDLNIFSKRIAILLKHDWERVKWDCKPIYIKILTRYSKNERKWRSSDYRKID